MIKNRILVLILLLIYTAQRIGWIAKGYKMSQLYVGSEIAQLKRVILHRPERALNHLTPSNYKDLLFDDVLAVERAAKEHDAFSNLLQDQGVEVILLQTLLTQTLAVPEAKSWLLAQQISQYRLGFQLAKKVREQLEQLSNNELAQVLLGGLNYSEFEPMSKFKQTISLMTALHKPSDFIIDPLPNHLFTRDTSCWIYAGVSLNPMALKARKRETNHLRAIYRWHPLFKNQSFATYLGKEPRDYDNVMIEGGDILVIGKGAVLIGMSERTSAQGIETLARALFFHEQASQIIVVQLPKHRACMHLDTVMTHVNTDTFSIYPEIIKENLACWKITAKKDEELSFSSIPNYRHAIATALGLDSLNLITTGGDKFAAEREQWNDANNVLTLRPGVVISYEGNQYTNEKYDKAGIKVLTIPGDQLGRGRGGARCMSCPIERARD